MSIGTGIALVVIGAILAFAVDVQTIAGINVDMIGWILMGAGVVIFILGLVLLARKRQSITTVRSGVDANGENVTQRRTATTTDDTL